MQQMFEDFMNQNSEEYHLIPEKDVNFIKIKLGKKHRKESDWAAITEILTSNNIIVAETVAFDPRLNVKDHILCIRDTLVVFTNIEDCHSYVNNLNKRDAAPNRLFQLGTMPFKMAVDISEQYELDLSIVFQLNSKHIVYTPKEKSFKAVMMQV